MLFSTADKTTLAVPVIYVIVVVVVQTKLTSCQIFSQLKAYLIIDITELKTKNINLKNSAEHILK